MSGFDTDTLPEDYEPCGDCGFDHEYEYEAAAQWHTANPCSYCLYDKEKELHGASCPTQRKLTQ